MVISYTALLYGSDYLDWAIQSVIDHVQEHHVIYSPIGAHGHRTDIPCPDTRDELYALALDAAGDKLRWHDAGPFPYEGAQRDSIHTYAPDADLILVLDADEIWPEGLAESIVVNYAKTNGWGIARGRLRLPMIHYWRSFHRAILHDPAFPVRVIVPHAPPFEATVRNARPINHMGYAQRSEVVFYKQHTHGHRNEWRRDVDWFTDIYEANRQYDCHPVGSESWQPEEINPWDYLPLWMKSHPYADLDIIP